MPTRFKFGLSGKPGVAGEMPFLDHLEELRWRILWSLLAFVIMGGVGIWASLHFNVMQILTDPAEPFLKCMVDPSGAIIADSARIKDTFCDGRFSYSKMTDPLFIQMKLGLLLGLLLSFPVIAYHVWSFLSPALHKREKRVIVPALYGGLLLFVGGVLLAYYYVLPSTVRIMLSFQTPELRQNLLIGDYIDLVAKLLVAFGAVFELPVVILILSSLGLVTSNFLRKNRRFAVAIMAVGAAVLTPGDAISATLYMMLPLLFLYEVSIGLAMLMERRRKRAATADVEADADDMEEPHPAEPAARSSDDNPEGW